MTAKILIVDDDTHYRSLLYHQVKKIGHQGTMAGTLKEGLAQLRSDQFDVVLLDVVLPDGSGLDAINDFRSGSEPPEIIIITGTGHSDGARLAMERDVWDYLQKGASLDAIHVSLSRALQYRESHQATKRPVHLKTGDIVGACPAFLSTLDKVAQAASSSVSVLLTGETGTGKELLARAIHENSPRASAPFVVVDCASLPESLVESVLFGHEKGAFTSADQRRDGLIKEADGGSLFLDEVGELPAVMQKSFLRVLQERRFRPIGSTDEITSDFRVIAATNRDLNTIILDGHFREDLLFRLRGLTIELPPLRARVEDIQPLVLHYIARICENLGCDMKGNSPDFMDCLERYPWPGNIRELANTVERAITVAGAQPILYAKHLPYELRADAAFRAFGEDTVHVDRDKPFTSPLLPWKKMRNAMERNYMEQLVKQSHGNIHEACSLSGLSRARIYEMLKKHHLSLTHRSV